MVHRKRFGKSSSFIKLFIPIVLMVLFLSVISVSCSIKREENSSESKMDWNSDIEFLRKTLPKKHKNLFFEKSREYFNSELDKIEKKVDELSDLEIALKLQEVIASMGDSHTSIYWYKFIDENKVLPIRISWFKDGLFIIKAHKKYKELLGKKIISINGHPIEEIVEKVSNLITRDNDSIIKDKIPLLIVFAQVMEFYGFSNKDGYFEMELETPEGKRVSVKVKPEHVNKTEVVGVTDNPPFCWKNRNKSFLEEYFEEDSIYYIQYNMAKNPEAFKEFESKIFKTIEEKPVEKLIFDMRFNRGGSSLQGTKFIKRLSKVKSINKRGKLFVVIGRETFSSAIINVMDFKKYTQAIFVGEETGGKPNHFGEVRSFVLPYSGLKVFYSTKYFKLSDTDLNTIEPDVKIEMTFNDYVNGIDPVYEWIKNFHKENLSS